MIGAASFSRYLGRAIDVFGDKYDEAGDLLLLTNGRLVAVEEGCLALADEDVPGEEVVTLVDLRLVGLVALRVPSHKPLQALEGGKATVHPMRQREPKGEPA